MKNETTVRTEIHYAQQVGEYQLPLLTLPQTSGQVRPDAAGLPQNPASRAVQPDVAERYALAAFAGCPENGLRVAGAHDEHSVRQVTPRRTKSAHSFSGWRI